MKRTVLVAILVLTASPARAAQYRLNAGFFFTGDSDRQEQRLFTLGADALFDRKNDDRVTVKAGTHTFEHDGDDEDFELLSLYGGKWLTSSVRLEGNAAFYRSSDWSPVLFGASVIATPGSFRFELSGSRELVDSLEAVRRRCLVDTGGVSADYSLTGEVMLVGSYYHQRITDGNDRDGEIGKIVYSPSRLEWLKLAAAVKHVEADFVGIGYYSPTNLTEYLGTVTLVRPLFGGKFTGSAGGGAGRREDDAGWKTVAVANARLRGWFNDSLGMDASAGYSNDGGASGDYDRYTLSLTLMYAFP